MEKQPDNVSVSVVLPIYNGAKTLQRAIDSILSQTHTPLELILIDDNSVDGSAVIAKQAALGDQRVRVIFHPKNQGLAATLNEGLRESRADLVARMDQDDEALPLRLARQVAFMSGHPDVAVAGSFVYLKGKTKEHDKLLTVPTEHEEIARQLPRENCIFHPSVMLRRSVVLGAGGYRTTFANAEDYDLWLRLSRIARLANIPEGLLRYSFTPSGMTLRRKWQQLGFVYKAQISFERPDLDDAELEERTAARLRSTDRRGFFKAVLSGTMKDLVDVSMYIDAIKCCQQLAGEVGAAWAVRQLTKTLIAKYA